MTPKIRKSAKSGSKICFLVPKSCVQRKKCQAVLQKAKNGLLYFGQVGAIKDRTISCVAFVQAYMDDNVEELEKCLTVFQEATIVVPPTLILENMNFSADWKMVGTKGEVMKKLQNHMIEQVISSMPNMETLKMPKRSCPPCSEGIGEIPQTFPDFDSVASPRHSEFLWNHIAIRPIFGVATDKITAICTVIESFYGLPAKVTDTCEIHLNDSPEQNSKKRIRCCNGVSAAKRNTADVTMKTGKGYRIRIFRETEEEFSVDVMGLIEATENHRPNKALLQIVVTDMPLKESGRSERLLGRATGDGTAVVSTYDSKNGEDMNALLPIYVATVHESLHTIGLDHCTVFECVMNASQRSEEDPGTIIPCLVCEAKLRRIFGPESTKKRLGRLKKFCGLKSVSWEKELENINQCISLLD